MNSLSDSCPPRTEVTKNTNKIIGKEFDKQFINQGNNSFNRCSLFFISFKVLKKPLFDSLVTLSFSGMNIKKNNIDIAPETIAKFNIKFSEGIILFVFITGNDTEANKPNTTKNSLPALNLLLPT